MKYFILFIKNGKSKDHMNVTKFSQDWIISFFFFLDMMIRDYDI